MKKFKQNLLFIVALVTGSLFFMGCLGYYLPPYPHWLDVSITPNSSPIKVGESIIFTGKCDLGCTQSHVVVRNDSGYYSFERSEVLSCSESGIVKIAFYAKYPSGGFPGVHYQNDASIYCIAGSDGAGASTVTRFSTLVQDSSSLLPVSSNESPILMSLGDEQTLTVKLNAKPGLATGVLFKLNESNSALKFVDNKNTCQIAANSDSCSVQVIAESVSTVTQGVTAIISGYTPENAYINVIQQSVSIIPTSSSDAPLVIEAGEEQILTAKLPKAKTGTTTATFNINGSNPVIKFVNNESTCQIISPSESCSVTVVGESASVVTQSVTATVTGFLSENAYIRVDKSEKYIFVSNSLTSGNIGGLNNADAICNADSMLNDHAILSGHKYKALLNGNNATKVGKSYYNINDQLIAVATTTNLLEENSSLSNIIGVGQNGVYAWTGLAKTGVAASNCNNWTSDSNTDLGTAGYTGVTTVGWSVTGTGGQDCSSANVRLYCVQQ